MSLVSIVIPTRRERFLQKTIDDIFAKAQGNIELIISLDGYWPDPPLKDRKNMVILHRGEQTGMRSGINTALHIAQGDYFMKIDGHCMLDEGFDVKLVANCEEDWLVVPRRYSLEPEEWVIKSDKPAVDAHYLSWPYSPGSETMNSPGGLHGNIWRERAAERKDILIDDEMSSQGSCWFTTRKHWERILDPMDIWNYGTFRQEFQELGNKTWLSGGRVVINKTTWYAHLHKGRTYGYGYGFTNERWAHWKNESELGRLFCIDFWMNNRWADRTRDIEWLIDKFWPVPGWPENWKTLPKPTWPETWPQFKKAVWG
jgi:glycosyltransferase involved in cell wall biosynthesis